MRYCFLLKPIETLALIMALAPATAQIGDAVDNPGLTWGTSTASTADWFSQSVYTHDGVDAGRSGAVGHGEQSDLTTTVQGPGTLTFWWKVSSENNPGAGRYDILYFWYDNSSSMSTLYGDVDWTQKTIAIPAGTHTLNWSYAKDIGGSAGLDAGFLDQVVYTPEGGDTTPPGPPNRFALWPQDEAILIEWQNPPDSDLAGIRIQRRTDTFPDSPTDGTNVYDGMGTTHLDSGLVNGAVYYYSIFAYDEAENYSAAARDAATPRSAPAFEPGDIAANEWSHVIDGQHGNDMAYDTCIDSLGRILVAGSFTGEGGHPGANGFVRQYSTDGTTVIWNEIFDSAIGDSTDRFYGVCIDSADNVIVTGQVYGEYPPYLNATVVRKYSSAGVLAWERRYHAEAWNLGFGITTDARDNVYIAGREFGGWDSRQGQWCILKYAPDGTLQPGFPITHNLSTSYELQDSASAIAVDQEGNFLVAGYVGNTTLMKFDWHVRLYNAAGILQWSDTMSGTPDAQDYAIGACVDASGDFYVAGSIEESGVATWHVVKYAGPARLKKARIAGEPWRMWTNEYAPPSGKAGVGRDITMTDDGGLLCAGYMVSADDYQQATILLIDPIEGIMLRRQMAALPVNSFLFSVSARGDQVSTAGYVGNGTDNDALISLSRLMTGIDTTGWSLY